MQTFDQALFDLHESGAVSYEDALRNADSVNELKLNIKLNSKRARSDDSRPKVELSLHEEKKDPEAAPESFNRPGIQSPAIADRIAAKSTVSGPGERGLSAATNRLS